MSTQSLTEEIYQVIKDSEAIGEIDTLGLDEHIHRTMTGYLGEALE